MEGLRFAFELARSRPRKLLTVVTSRTHSGTAWCMWDDEIASEVAEDTRTVTWDKMLVDAMTVRMVNKPESLDTIVATNLHADILSDLAAALAGSIGIAPHRQPQSGAGLSLDVRADHGSAFDIMGKGIANPIGTFWSIVMMLDHLGEPEAGRRLMTAIEQVTADRRVHHA